MNRIKYLFMTVLAALMFTGCAKDDDALTSLGEISVSQTYLSIPATGGEAKVIVKANADWKIKDVIINDKGKYQYKSGTDKKTNEPIYSDLWCTVSKLFGEAGETELVFTAPASDGGHEFEFVVEVGNTRQHIKVRQGDFTPEEVTCQFVNEQGLDGKNYRISGIVTSIANTTYGNMYITDETGTVYIYGTLDEDGAEKNFESLGIEVGDEVTVEGPRTTYGGTTVELVNVTVVKIVKSLIKLVGATETTGISKDGGEFSVKVAYKGSGAYFSIPDNSKNMVEFKESKFIAGVPSKLEKNPADTCVFTFNVLPNVGAARSGSIVFTSSNSGNTSEQTYKFTQEGSILSVTCVEFNAAPVGSAQYRLIGLVTKVANEKYGNIYVQDYTGSVYVYGTTNYADYPVKAGDVVNIVGPRAEHKGSPQMKDGTIDELCASAEPISLADFNAAADDNDKYYLLTGKITEIANDKYGNVYIEDGTGAKVYLYGVYGDWTGANKQYFIKDNGIAVGDEITVVTIKTSYNGAAQGKNAVCFGVKKAE